MKKTLVSLAMTLGVLVAIFGLVGMPFIQDLLPVDIMLSSGNQATHQYLRVVPAQAQRASFLPHALLAAGLLLIMVGLAFRRRLRR